MRDIKIVRARRFTAFISLALIFASLRVYALTPFSQEDVPTKGYLFEVHGSNTIGAALAPALIKRYLEERGAQNVTVKSAGKENEAVVSGTVQGKSIAVRVAAHGSSTGYKALKSGEADVWASSRPVRDSEAKEHQKRADLKALDSEHVIAVDGLAILVHPRNPVKSLTTTQVAELFSGKINNWKQVGGPDMAVTVYARDESSGTWDTFSSLVLGDAYKLVKTAKRYESNDQLSDDVSKDRGAIGFSGFASVRSSKALAIAEANSPAIAPDQLSLATEDYPLARRLFFYTSGRPDKAAIDGFIHFTHSAMGQDIVADSGFVSQNIVEVDPKLDNSVPESFRQLTRNYNRLTVNFRFAAGRSKLDNKAQRDLERLLEYLRESGRSSTDLMLIGFADKSGDELRSQMVSELRANAVNRALKERGAEVKAVTGYGQYMSVGASGGEHGASRNGRVEVWVRKDAK
ncbi:substrate-binding domain-containing protein [Hahella sp. HN01]|nr:substrate-binding domain-containing protein [Hahella sp. HN01]MBU6950280.1 substrate-binding domain-containing protein [Hahella sp. HN01]